MNKRAVLMFLCLAVLVLGSFGFTIHYYLVAEHLVYSAFDEKSQLDLSITCKGDGISTYYPYAIIRRHRGRDVTKTELCCGRDTIGDCRSVFRGIKGISFDPCDETLNLNFESRPPMKIKVAWNSTELRAGCDP
jgi:hypothetical protein